MWHPSQRYFAAAWNCDGVIHRLCTNKFNDTWRVLARMTIILIEEFCIIGTPLCGD